MAEHDDVMRNQISFYRHHAATYDQGWPGPSLHDSTEQVVAALHTFHPAGDVLEIACGTGNWTARLVQYCDRLTALDASPEMLKINSDKLEGDPRVRFFEGDILSWAPDQQFDVVFFSLWLSHVPAPLFESFWSQVASWLRPNGRVFFVDELAHEMWQEDYVEEDSSLVRRQAGDGTQHEIVKIFWDPQQLVGALSALGWDASVTGAPPLYWGTATMR